MQKEPPAFVSSSASVLRPVNKKHIEEIRKDLVEKSLLFAIVYRVDPDPSIRTLYTLHPADSYLF